MNGSVNVPGVSNPELKAAIKQHDSNGEAHADIRELVNTLAVGIMSGELTLGMATQDGVTITTRDGEEILAVRKI